MNKRITYLLIFYLIADIIYSSFQHYHGTIDGDLASIILPAERYQKVLTDPFGFDVLRHNAIYAAPNRFFVHWSISHYFKTVPFIFQYFANPINSIYLSGALIKTATQVLAIYILSAYISGQYKLNSKDFLIAAALITPLFQTNGFTWQMGIIDPSLTYTFFYGLAGSLLFLFFLPFFMVTFFEKKIHFNYLLITLLLLLAIVISFSAPINTAVILMTCPCILVYKFWQGFNNNDQLPLLKRISAAFLQIPGYFVVIFSFTVFLSAYSFYIGRNNSENFWITIPMIERYKRLPKGFIVMFTSSGPALLVLMILTNVIILVKRKADQQAQKIIIILKWLVVFSLLYILLLPLGGYRPYRPNIIRRDSILPVLLSLIIFYGISTIYLLKNIAPQYKKTYLMFIIIPLMIFTIVDLPNRGNNYCEKEALKKIAASTEKIVLLDQSCNVMAWDKITNYNDSKLNTDLLRYWGVIHEEKYYYQK